MDLKIQLVSFQELSCLTFNVHAKLSLSVNQSFSRVAMRKVVLATKDINHNQSDWVYITFVWIFSRGNFRISIKRCSYIFGHWEILITTLNSAASKISKFNRVGLKIFNEDIFRFNIPVYDFLLMCGFDGRCEFKAHIEFL